MKKTKSIKGITLIALVITIIILLIIVGIAISQLTGSGLFENSKLAKEKYENEQIKEETQLGKYTNYIEHYINGNRDENNFEIFTADYIPNTDVTVTVPFNKNIVGDYYVAIDLGDYLKGNVQYITKYSDKLEVRIRTTVNTNDEYSMKVYLYKASYFPFDIVCLPKVQN